MGLQRCKTLHVKRCKVTNSLREVGRTLSHMYGRLYGTTEGRNVVLNPVPSHCIGDLHTVETRFYCTGFGFGLDTTDFLYKECVIRMNRYSLFPKKKELYPRHKEWPNPWKENTVYSFWMEVEPPSGEYPNYGLMTPRKVEYGLKKKS